MKSTKVRITNPTPEKQLANSGVESIYPQVIHYLAPYSYFETEMNRIAVFAFVAVAIIAVAVAADFYVDHELNTPEFILALQKRCAKQTERVVAGSGGKQSNSPVNGTVESYTDHYNARLERCLILFKYIINDTA